MCFNIICWVCGEPWPGGTWWNACIPFSSPADRVITEQLVCCSVIEMSCNLQVGCSGALCQASVRPLSLSSSIINRTYLHTKLSNFNPGALFPCERLPLKVISAALSGVIRLTGSLSERRRCEGKYKQENYAQRKTAGKEKPARNKTRKSGLPAVGMQAGTVDEVPGSGDRIPVTRQDFLKETPTVAQRVFPFKAAASSHTAWARNFRRNLSE